MCITSLNNVEQIEIHSDNLMCIATTYNIVKFSVIRSNQVCDDSFLLYILNTLLSHFLGNLFF